MRMPLAKVVEGRVVPVVVSGDGCDLGVADHDVHGCSADRVRPREHGPAEVGREGRDLPLLDLLDLLNL